MNAYYFSDGINTIRFFETGYDDANRKLQRTAVFPEKYKCISIEWNVKK